MASGRQRSHTMHLPEITMREGLKPSSISKLNDTSGWQANALKFHDQVLHEIERLIQNLKDKASADQARDALKKAQIPHGQRNKVTPEKFLAKAEQAVTILQRIELQGTAVLQPPPT